MNKSQLIETITEAFKAVRLGLGIGLWEGQALDDYESDSVRKSYRDKD